MQNKIYKIDDGQNFGKWNDEISKFMYFDSTKEILCNIEIPSNVVDLGGANGLIKSLIPQIITVDIDESKNPDNVANILNYTKKHDLGILRYVLHYLNDLEVIELFKNLNCKNLLIQQFVNEDLRLKYFNSINEIKYFRTKSQLLSLLPSCKIIYEKEILITKQFYKNRLNNENSIEHTEIILGLWL